MEQTQQKEKQKKQQDDLGYLKYIPAIIRYICISLVVLSIAFPVWFGWTSGVAPFEGTALIADIVKAQREYHTKHNTFHYISETPVSFDPVLNIDASNNRFFRLFSGTATEDTFTLRVYGREDSMFSYDNHFVFEGNIDTLSKDIITIPLFSLYNENERNFRIRI
ncbi:MAG: hypothetical protein FWC85_01035 [Elusimicrobia bacterium]|nr:hypothetical protein [Elusimicrobiota bacterium]